MNGSSVADTDARDQVTSTSQTISQDVSIAWALDPRAFGHSVIVVQTTVQAPQTDTVSNTSTEGAKMPAVDVATIGRVASGLVFLFCMASLVIGQLTGFHAIFPPIGLLIAGIAALLYIISVALAAQWRR